MRAIDAPVGARVVDSLPFSQAGTVAQAKALRAAGVEGIALYLGVASKAQALAAGAAGLFAFGVTLGGHYDGALAVAQAKALGLVAGVTLFLDVEGKEAYDTQSAELVGKIDAWALAVQAGGYVPGLYLGSPQPLTSDELTRLAVVRYWKGQGRTVDRTGALAEPRPGWCMWQMFPSITLGGVLVDANIVGQDFKGRVPTVAL